MLILGTVSPDGPVAPLLTPLVAPASKLLPPLTLALSVCHNNLPSFTFQLRCRPCLTILYLCTEPGMSALTHRTECDGYWQTDEDVVAMKSYRQTCREWEIAWPHLGNSVQN